MVRVNPLAQYQQAAYNAPRRSGGVTFMPPVAMPRRQAVVRRAPVAAAAAAQGMSLADRIRANEETFQQNAMMPAQVDDGGFKEDAVRGLGWLVGNPVSRAVLKPLEVLDYPRSAAVGTIRQLLETEALEDFNKTIAKLPGIDYTPIAKPEGNEEGFQWGEMWRDTKKHEGFGTSIIEPQFEDANIWVKRGLGLAGDIGADPLAWLSAGTRAGSGVESRMEYLNKLLDAQQAAGTESRAAAEAAETAADWARLMGGTGADEAAEFTAAEAARAGGRLDELSMIGDKKAMDLIRKRGVNIATPAQLEAMNAPQHALRLSGVPIQDVLAGPVRLFDRQAGDALARGVERFSEPASRAMSRFLSPGKEVWSNTAGRAARKVITPKGAIGQKLGPAAERLLTDRGGLSTEAALRAYRVNENLRLAIGDFRAPANQFLHQLHQSIKGLSDEETSALIKAAEEEGLDNELTRMPEQVLEIAKSMGLDPPELKPWMLPNGKMSKYVVPHVLSRDSFRFFNRIKKGDNPALDFIRRDLGIHDRDLLEEGGFLQRRFFRPNADGSPKTFKIGKDEITINTGSLDELEEKLGGLLRSHGFEGKLYESNPTEAWRRYINSTEKDFAKRVAEADAATNFGMAGARYKGAKPKSYDPYGREVENLPAEGETEPRWTRAKSTERAPTGDDVWEFVEDKEATEARNKIILGGGKKNVHRQVADEFADTAAAERQTIAGDIERTRRQAEQAFDLAREKSAKNLARAEKMVANRRVRVDKLEAEYSELLKEGSANQQLIDANVKTIHGVRSQTPKKIKAAIEARLQEISDELKHEQGRLDSLEAGLKHALEGREQHEADALLDRFVTLQETMMDAEGELAKQKDRARKAVARRIKADTGGRESLASKAEVAQAKAMMDAGPNTDEALRAAELQTRAKNLTEQMEIRRNAALDLERQAQRIEERMVAPGGSTTPRTEARQVRMGEAFEVSGAQARKLREQAAVEWSRATSLENDLAGVQRRIKNDPWLTAQKFLARQNEFQNQIDNFLNPTAGIDVRAAQIRVDRARRDIIDFGVTQTQAKAKPPYQTPLAKSEARLTEAVGHKPDIHHTLYSPDDMEIPSGDGLHQLIIAEPGTDIEAWRAMPDGSGSPGYIASLLWNAETGEIAWANTTEAMQRKGIGASTLDYATKLSEEKGFVPPKHSLDQTDAGAAWAPAADEKIARWARDDNTMKGLASNEANDARALLDSPEAREWQADETLAYDLRRQIDRIENPSEELGFTEWTEVGRQKPAALPRANRVWSGHASRRRHLLGEMERVRDEAYFTKPGMGEGEFYKRPKPRARNPKEPKWMEGYRSKPSTRRLRGQEPWWTEQYPTRPDQSSTKASRARRLKKLQKELDVEDEWLSKHPQPPAPKPDPRAFKYRATIAGKKVRLERGKDGVWTFTMPDRPPETFRGDVAAAFKRAEELAKKPIPTGERGLAVIESLPPPKEGMVRLYRGDPTKPSLSPEQARRARSARGLDWINDNPEMLARDSVQGRWFTTDKDLAAKYPTNRDPGEGNIVRYVDITQAEYDKIKGLADQPDVIKALSRDPNEVVLSAAHMRRVKDVPVPVAADDGGLAGMKERLANIEQRMKLARKTQAAEIPELPNRNPWEQPYEPSWWRDSGMQFSESLGDVVDDTDPLWSLVESADMLSTDDLEQAIAEHWNRLNAEGKQRMTELGWVDGRPPGATTQELQPQIREARRALANAAFEQGTLPEELVTPPKPPPNPEDYIHERFDPKIAEAKLRIKAMGGKGRPEELEAIRTGIQEPANARIAGMQAENETLRFQNQRIGEMVADLYQTRMPDPVADWRKALDNADAARAVHQSILDYIEKYAVRQRAIDMVEKNRRAGAPSARALEDVAERRLRPEDAQGLMKAVRDVEHFMTNADQILPVRTRKQIEAALMAHEQALHALTMTNDLPAKALGDMQKAAKDGSLPKVLKAQVRDVWKEVGQDGDILLDKELQRAWFGVEETLDSKLFGRLFTTWTNFFKTYATLTPGFHVRNAISAIFMNASEGVTIAEQIKAVRLWGQYRRAENPVKFLAGLPEADRNAFRATFASGPAGQFLETGVGEARAGAGRAAERLFANPATRFSKNLGQWVEGPQRLALGLHTTANGGSVGQALSRITRIHFDYAQVSKFDEQMKRIIPFWTFMSRNVPLQFTQMWMKPSAYLKYQSFARNMQLGTEGDSNIPSYITQGGGLDIGVKTPGWAEKIPLLHPPAGMPIVVQPDLPQNRYFDDLQRVTNALSGNGVGQMATNLNPMLTVPAEFASRTDFFTGQQFPNEASVQVGGAATPWAMALATIGQARKGADGKWYIDAAAMNAIRGLDPNLDRLLRLMPQAGGLESTDKTGASTNARQAESWARYMGLPVRTISPQQQRSEKRQQYFKARERRLEKLNSGG